MKFRADIQCMKGFTVLALNRLFFIGIIIVFIFQHQVILIIVGIFLQDIDKFLFLKQEHNRIFRAFYVIGQGFRVDEVQG